MLGTATPAPGSEPLLSVRDLQTHFFTTRGVVKAVDGVTFDLAAGQRMAIVGESGSGKSVTTLSLLRLVGYPGRTVGGSVSLDGRNLLDLSSAQLNAVRGREVAMVFQDAMTALNPVLKVSDQITAPMLRHLRLSRAEARRRGIELLQQVGIPAAAERFDAYPHQLSGGMRQRVMIAMALACQPRLLLADEPTTALDVTIQAQIVKLLKGLAETSRTAVLFVTHDMGLVARFADVVAVMYAGRIVEIGPAVALFRRSRHPYTQGLLRSIPPLTGPRPERLLQVEGSPPDLVAPPPGCPFHPRCPHAVSRCLVERPELAALDDAAPDPPLPHRPPAPSHQAACWVLPEIPREVASEVASEVAA